MKKFIYRANSRGIAEHGWLTSRHTFSFASYYNPERMGFGRLRVLNDDIVSPGQGFGLHSHENMEIISIPLLGTLKHKDSTGHTQILQTGDVQVMSAGTGITHSEWNHSTTEPVHFLQIWVLPNRQNISPCYAQMSFEASKRKNRFQTLVCPKSQEKKEEALGIHQETWFSRADLEVGQTLAYGTHRPGNGIYIFLLEGEIEVADEKLDKRDALGCINADQLIFKAGQAAQILCIEIPSP